MKRVILYEVYYHEKFLGRGKAMHTVGRALMTLMMMIIHQILYIVVDLRIFSWIGYGVEGITVLIH